MRLFGETSINWGGVENIDLDVETAGVDAGTPRAAAPSSHLPDPTDLQVVSATHSHRASQREERMFTVDRQMGAILTPASPSQPATQAKLKDLFALGEEEGESFAI